MALDILQLRQAVEDLFPFDAKLVLSSNARDWHKLQFHLSTTYAASSERW